MGRKSKNSFVIQGSILAFAGILVRIIGLIYRIPLTRILGDEGNGYYSTAYDIYNVLILLSSQSMPLAVSKIVSEKLERRQYKNAYKIFKGALFYVFHLVCLLSLEPTGLQLQFIRASLQQLHLKFWHLHLLLPAFLV